MPCDVIQPGGRLVQSACLVKQLVWEKLLQNLTFQLTGMETFCPPTSKLTLYLDNWRLCSISFLCCIHSLQQLCVGQLILTAIEELLCSVHSPIHHCVLPPKWRCHSEHHIGAHISRRQQVQGELEDILTEDIFEAYTYTKQTLPPVPPDLEYCTNSTLASCQFAVTKA
jgi:hypothetical protein